MEIFNVMVLVAVVLYGVAYGIHNFIQKIICTVTNNQLIQNRLGRICDIIWFFSLLYLFGLYHDLFTVDKFHWLGL